MADSLDVSGMPSSRRFRIGVYALIFNGESILLAHRRDIDWWNLPGGGMEAGETVDEAMIREVREETGLKVRVEQLVGVYSKPQKQEVVLTFRCAVIGGTLHVGPCGEPGMRSLALPQKGQNARAFTASTPRDPDGALQSPISSSPRGLS